MPRSLSRGERAWLATWGFAVVCALAVCALSESFWRGRGFVPQAVDSRELWAQQRARLSSGRAAATRQVALLGASRIQFGLSPQHFRDEAARLSRPDLNVSMLAVNAHYPLAALRDLSEDPHFRGLAIVGIDSRGFVRDAWDMQSHHVQHYRQQWGPAAQLSRYLLTQVQTHLVLGQHGNGLATVLKTVVIGGGALPRGDSSVQFFSDRSAATDYTRGNLEAIRSERVAGTMRAIRDYTPPTPRQWLADADEVVAWVGKINRRGGRVVFYHEPVSDETQQFEAVKFPRERYWDALEKRMPGAMIEFSDYPELRIDTPDTSHIDAKDIEQHTRALVRILAAKNVL